MPIQISEEDFKNWWLMPVGVEVKTMLRERIEMISEKGFSSLSVIRDSMSMAEMLGHKLEIKALIEMDFKELMGEE